MEYAEGIFKIGSYYLETPGILEMAAKFRSIRSVMKENYYECVKAGMVKMETLDTEIKAELWEKAKVVGEGLKKTELIDLCRCIYWFESMKCG